MKKKKSINITSYVPYIGLALTVIVFAIITEGKTVSAINLKILTNQIIVTALVAIGAVYAFASGALDLSLSGSVALSAIAGAVIGLRYESFIVMIVTTIIASFLIALFKGVVAAYLKLPIFIVTIVFGGILSAIGLVLLGKETTLSVRSLVNVSNMTWINIAFVAVFYLFALYIFNYTKIGKSCKLQGGNLLAASQLGINAKKNIIIAFLMGGIGVALAAIIILLQTKTATATTGGSVGINIMIAIVLGGMPLSGGPRSKMSAAIIGAVTISVLNNGLAVIGVSTGVVQIVRSVVFLVVVFITSLSYRTKLLPR